MAKGLESYARRLLFGLRSNLGYPEAQTEILSYSVVFPATLVPVLENS
jgi:hypothetical protein